MICRPDPPSRRFSPRDLTCRDLRNHPGLCQHQPIHGCCWKVRCCAAPQSFLKRFALRWWQLNCRFAASSAPKLQYFRPTHSSWKLFTMLTNTACTGINLILAAPNCPVLDAWGILYIQTTSALQGVCVRPRIRRRALRAPPLHPPHSVRAALRAVRSH